MSGRCEACLGGIMFAVDILVLSLTSLAKAYFSEIYTVIDRVKRLKRVQKVKEDGV